MKHSARIIMLAATVTGCVGVMDDGVSDGSNGGGASSPPRMMSGPMMPGPMMPGQGGNDPPGPGPIVPPVKTPPAETATLVDPVMPLRRLTRNEYDNVLLDLLADRGPSGRISPGFYLPGEPAGASGFSTPGLMSEVDHAAFREAAEAAATRALEKLPKILPTCPARDDACIDAFLREFGARAFRRPLDARELETLRGFDRTTLVKELGYSFEERVRALIATMLQMPSFLYRWELGPSNPIRERELVRLNDWEMASRLSFFLWSSMPDAQLFAAAAAGKLSTEAEVEEHARRMVKDPKFDRSVIVFFREWLELTQVETVKKDIKTYPDANFPWRYAPRAMGVELDTFVDKIVAEGDGKFSTLMTAPWSYVNKHLAPQYGLGLGMTITDTAFERVEFDPMQRPGLLTRLAFLSANANAYEADPVKRGKVIREKMLCQHLAAPPADIPPLPPPRPEATIRERHDEHATVPACRACHQLMDPLGYAFSNFDAVGTYHATEKDAPIDASGTIVNIDGGNRAFKNVKEMVEILASSREVQRCFATQWMRFALRREVVPLEEAALAGMSDRFAADGGDIRELLVSVAASRSFRYRAPAKQEVLP